MADGGHELRPLWNRVCTKVTISDICGTALRDWPVESRSLGAALSTMCFYYATIAQCTNMTGPLRQRLRLGSGKPVGFERDLDISGWQ